MHSSACPPADCWRGTHARSPQADTTTNAGKERKSAASTGCPCCLALPRCSFRQARGTDISPQFLDAGRSEKLIRGRSRCTNLITRHISHWPRITGVCFTIFRSATNLQPNRYTLSQGNTTREGVKTALRHLYKPSKSKPRLV